MTDTGLHAKHKQVLQDSVLEGERFASGTDALTALLELKQNKRGLRWVLACKVFAAEIVLINVGLLQQGGQAAVWCAPETMPGHQHVEGLQFS